MNQAIDRPSVAEVVEENRETFDLVANGDDEIAEIAQNIIDTAEETDG